MLRKYKFSVFGGAYHAKNVASFCEASRQFQDRIDFDTFYCNDIHTKHLSIESTVDRLLNADAAIALSHLHQGLPYPFFSSWIMKDYSSNLSRLDNTVGNLKNLKWKCSIFQQNKYDYYSRLPDLCNPSLRIPLREDGTLTSDMKREILR